jgi:hypothetical protein
MGVRSRLPLGRDSSRASTDDLLLLAVPVPALAGLLGGGALGEFLGAVASLALVCYGLFVSPPGGATGRSG